MQSLRYGMTFVLSCGFSVLLFYLMQQMLVFEQVRVHSSETPHGLDFVRLIREPNVVQKKHVTPLPKKPPPPKKKPPPPKMQTLKADIPPVQRIALRSPRFQTKINLDDALFLGDFKKAPIASLSPSAPTQTGIQIDEEVVPLVRIAPKYPRKAARLGMEGWVKLEVVINARGTVDEAKVIDAVPRRVFNSAALRAIKRWKFRPKILNGRAVSRTAVQKMQFKLSK